ncbi:MAG: hypothetical protein K2P78_05295 [Gemmataceae bacterium]|nr:hypothetical protein [Gemmataceae bacterium]
MSYRTFSEYVALREGLMTPDRPPAKGMSRVNALPITNDQRRRLRVNPARPPAPGGYVHAVVPWNMVARIEPNSSS